MPHRWPGVTRTGVHTTERQDTEETTHYTRCTGEGFIDTFHSQVMAKGFLQPVAGHLAELGAGKTQRDLLGNVELAGRM